jgi:serine/threonine protein kinase
MEYCSGGDLYARAPYTEITAATLMSQLCSAIAHMHKNSVVHRDLKCENIMFESKENPMPVIKVLDFGLSKKFLPGMSTRVMTERVGTLYTMAPQVLHGSSRMLQPILF